MGPGIDVLLIDDDRLDVKTVQRAFRVARVEGQLSTAGSGESALRGLRSQRFRPQLILLDLNMPAMNGLEFLQEIKRDQKLRVIPVVVLTTSTQTTDRDQSYELGAAGYLVKERDFDEFVEVIRTLREYWTTSQLPEWQ